MTERDIQLALWYHLYQRYASGGLVVPNVHMEHWFEADLLALTRSGGTWEIEIKTTVADYRKDAEKVTDCTWKTHGATGFLPGMRKHDLLASGCEKGPNRFSFAMPARVIDKVGLDNIPGFAGVLSIHENDVGTTWVRALRDPKILHRKTAAEGTRKRMLVGGYYRYWKLLEKTPSVARFRDDSALFMELIDKAANRLDDDAARDALRAVAGELTEVYHSLNNEIQTDCDDGDSDGDDLCGTRGAETA